MSRPSSVVSAVAIVLTAVVGCSGDTTGTPRPGSSSSAPTVPSPRPSETRLADLAPCDLITSAEAGELGATGDGESQPLSSSRGCVWTVAGSHSFSVVFFDNKGIDELNLTGIRTPVTIGGRPAERVEENSGPGFCLVAFPITDTSVAEASVKARLDTAKACQVAEQVADVIAAKLP